MKYLNSIRAQLLLAITIILFVFLLLAMGGLYLLQKDALTKESIKKVTEIGSVLKTGLKCQMFTRNTELTQTLVDEIKAYKNITETYIINADGVVKFASNPESIGKKLIQDSDECRQCHHDATGRNNLTLQTINSQGASILRNVTPIYLVNAFEIVPYRGRCIYHHFLSNILCYKSSDPQADCPPYRRRQ